MPVSRAHLPRAFREPPALDPDARARAAPRAARAAHQPVLSQGPARQLRQARAHADAGADEHRRRDAARLDASRYWDENLLQGPPPLEPVPAGRRHHRAPDLRRARLRAGALVSRARREGRPRRAARALVPRRGAPRTPTRSRSARACSSGPRSCATSSAARSQPRLPRRTIARPYRDDPAPRRDLLPRARFLTTTSLIATRGCHNRCGFCYLATDGPAHAVPACATSSRSSRSSRPTASPTRVFIDNNLGSRPDYLRAPVPRAARRSRGSGAPRSRST